MNDFVDGIARKMPGRVIVAYLRDEEDHIETDPEERLFATRAELNAWTDKHAGPRDHVIIVHYTQDAPT